MRNAHIWTPHYVQQVPVTSRSFFSFCSQEWQKSLCISSVENGQKRFYYNGEIIRPRKSAFTSVLLKFPNDPGKPASTSFMKVLSNPTPTENAKNCHLWLILPSFPGHLTEIKVWELVIFPLTWMGFARLQLLMLWRQSAILGAISTGKSEY